MINIKKIITISLATCMSLSPILVKAEEEIDKIITPIESSINLPVEEIIEMEYIQFKGEIEKADDENGPLSIVVKNDNTEGLDAMKAYIDNAIILSDKTMEFVDGHELKEGMVVTIFYHKETIMLESYPPMLGVDVVIINDNEEYQGLMVSKFDEDLLNAEGDMVIRPSDETVIVDKEGNKLSVEDLPNRDLIAFFDIVRTSYPGQTSPKKIVVMPEREDQVIEEAIVNEFILKSEFIKEIMGIQMIPLRLVGESLGYEVSWKQETKTAELVRGPQWTAVTIGQDNYNFARMLIKLGAAPQLIDSRTYVPATFIEEVLKAEVEVIAEGLKIIY
ncbi:MAG: copper amine oxidase N-terminal domain-containing protein [Tissierellia bacterium]|nr:copper amine oxidase N-terminal domain-containing protein [Tissierellia bacterium]